MLNSMIDLKNWRHSIPKPLPGLIRFKVQRIFQREGFRFERER
jgi:hypothetical protein